MNQNKTNYILHLADNALILGHRLSEWCGHGPILEQDMAMTNIALDFIGEARNFYQYAAELINASSDNPPSFGGVGGGHDATEDTLAYLRDVREFRNCLLVEQPNGDFARTIARQFIYDSYHFYFLEKLSESTDERLAGIAEKTLKEATYHLRWSSDWVVRLGDGTEESHNRIQLAFNELWEFSGELLTETELEPPSLLGRAGEGLEGVSVDLNSIKNSVFEKRKAVFEAATLKMPADAWMQKGGKQGRHTEHLGFLLAEMQFLQRAYPNSTW
jgi:ring-1,2-phenylacetyl-CoA epoxidase subunit PaaC